MNFLTLIFTLLCGAAFITVWTMAFMGLRKTLKRTGDSASTPPKLLGKKYHAGTGPHPPGQPKRDQRPQNRRRIGRRKRDQRADLLPPEA